MPNPAPLSEKRAAILVEEDFEDRELPQLLDLLRATGMIVTVVGPLADTDRLILRGRMFTLDRPLTYAILKHEREEQPQTAPATVGSPYTGFRVVLKLPSPLSCNAATSHWLPPPSKRTGVMVMAWALQFERSSAHVPMSGARGSLAASVAPAGSPGEA